MMRIIDRLNKFYQNNIPESKQLFVLKRCLDANFLSQIGIVVGCTVVPDK